MFDLAEKKGDTRRCILVHMQVQRTTFNTIAKLNERDIYTTDFKNGEGTGNSFATAKSQTRPMSHRISPCPSASSSTAPNFTLTDKTGNERGAEASTDAADMGREAKVRKSCRRNGRESRTSIQSRVALLEDPDASLIKLFAPSFGRRHSQDNPRRLRGRKIG
jgi:hypothetical protein